MDKEKNIRVTVNGMIYEALVTEQARRRKVDGKKTALADLYAEFAETGMRKDMYGVHAKRAKVAEEVLEGSKLGQIERAVQNFDQKLRGSVQKEDSHQNFEQFPDDSEQDGELWIIIMDQEYPQRFRDQESIAQFYELKRFEKEQKIRFEREVGLIGKKWDFENSQKGRLMKILEHEEGSFYIFADRLGYPQGWEGEMDLVEEFDDIMNNGEPDLPANILHRLVLAFGERYGGDWIRFGIGKPDWENLEPLKVWK